MVTKTIEDLPDEVLAELFSYLSAVSLEKCCEASKRWNDIIHTSRQTKSRLTTVVTTQVAEFWSDTDKDLLRNPPLSWKTPTQLHWITLHDIKVDVPGLKEFLESHSSYIRRLTIRNIAEGEIQPILRQLPLIRNLDIFEDLKFSSPEPIVLENLKCLKINESSVNILEKIKTTDNITEFSITDLKMDGKFATVAKFLMRCPALKKLTIWIKKEGFGNLSEMFGATGLSAKVPFRLKFLEIRGFHAHMYEANIIKFLELHEQTLEHLDVSHQRYFMSPDLCRHILAGFPNLKTLKVYGASLISEKSFYLCLEPLHNVTDLTLMSDIPKHELSKAFYSLFPSLEKLTVNPYLSYFPKFFNTLNKFHPKLTYLSYSSFRLGTPRNLEFRNLKYLAVNEVKCKPAFMNFVTSHRNLIELKIGNVPAELTNDDVTDILGMPALRHLELGGTKAEVKRMFDLIKKDYKRLQYAKLSYKIDPKGETRLHKEILFPSEKKFWKPQRYERFFDTSSPKKSIDK